jgi:hypothetical protein
MYSNGKTSKQVWAVTNSAGEIVWTRGGTSTSPRMMVYSSEEAALRAVNNPWVKRVHNIEDLKIQLIYDKTEVKQTIVSG